TSCVHCDNRSGQAMFVLLLVMSALCFSHLSRERLLAPPFSPFFPKKPILVRGGGVDTSLSGWWKVNVDGSGLTRLTSDTAAVNSVLNPYTRYPWSNVSRDG